MVNTSTDYKNNKESLIKDIAEREKIISDYKKYGVLDRDKAINKIQELRIKDKEVEEITIFCTKTLKRFKEQSSLAEI